MPSLTSDDFCLVRRFVSGVLRPLLNSLRSSLNTSSNEAISEGRGSRLSEDGVGEGVACLCFLCFFKEGVGDGEISGWLCFLSE